jgi:hypothetical protein
MLTNNNYEITSNTTQQLMMCIVVNNNISIGVAKLNQLLRFLHATTLLNRENNRFVLVKHIDVKMLCKTLRLDFVVRNRDLTEQLLFIINNYC